MKITIYGWSTRAGRSSVLAGTTGNLAACRRGRVAGSRSHPLWREHQRAGLYRESWVRQSSAAQVRALPRLRTSGSEPGRRRLPSCSTVMLGACPDQSKPILGCAACRLAGWTAGGHAQVLGRSALAGLLTTAGTAMAGDRDQDACASSARSVSSATATDRVARSPGTVSANVGQGARRAVLAHVSRTTRLSAGLESQPCPPGRCTLRRFPGHATRRKAGRLVLRGPRCMCS
jgi:hypothetical protein